MKKRLAKILMFCMVLNMLFLPVRAEEETFEDGISYPEMTEESISAFSDAVLPESMMENAPEEIQTFGAQIPEFDANEWLVLYFTNYIRVQNGLAPLSMEAKLQSAADIRVNELPALFSHTRPNGSDCFTVLNEQGVSYRTAGENIAAGQIEAIDVIESWWYSEGHRANMLSSDFSHLGTGYTYDASSKYGSYWVQLFTGDCTPSSITVLEDKYDRWILPGDRTIDEIGLVLEVKCEHGTSYMPIMESMCTGLDRNLKNQDQTVTVHYKGKTASLTVQVCDPMPFTDVAEDQWYYSYVEYVYYNQIMTGLNATTFGPNDPLARAQFAVILYRMEGEPSVIYSKKFPDVAAGQWYTDAILWASDAKVVNGYSDTGYFGPGDKINREQMAVMMYRYANYLGLDTSQKSNFSKFADASSVNAFAKEAMQWAVGTGIISGKDNGTRIDPQGNASRAECATIINRFIDYYR